MLDAETRTRIDSARDILVSKVPDPKSQVEQITIALIQIHGPHRPPVRGTRRQGDVLHRRLQEVPLGSINKASAREKSGWHKKPETRNHDP